MPDCLFLILCGASAVNVALALFIGGLAALRLFHG